MTSLAEIWPDAPSGDPLIINDAPAPTKPPVPPKPPVATPPPPPPVEEIHTKPFVRPPPARAGEPDAGVMGVHTVVQGMITYQPKGAQYALAPWQVIPFSEGFEFVADNMNVFFHRGVYQVGNSGTPLPEGPVSPASFARNSWTYFTPADSICGFSGLRFSRYKLTMDRVRAIHEMSCDGPKSPWSADAFVPGMDMESVLPKFWAELDETPGMFNSKAPFVHVWDVVSGKKIKVVPFTHWHFLAPIPGVSRLVQDACVARFGSRFLLNRIYLGGTGWQPNREAVRMGPEPMLMADLANIVTNQKLQSVILPCLRSSGKSGSSDGIQNEMFSRPSAPALQRLSGDRKSPHSPCF